jgi:lipopolysaccharide transport system ATP-binding protein
MYVRLAFAVAAHLEPEILLVDEVLAVGDTVFQHKCLSKIREVAGDGRTVLLVSHNMSSITRLCRRAYLLESGRLTASGSANEVVSQYLLGDARNDSERTWPNGLSDAGVDEFKLKAIRIRNHAGAVSTSLDIRFPFTVEVEYRVYKPLHACRVAIGIDTADGVKILGSYNSDASERAEPLEPGGYLSECRLPGDFFNAGRHLLSLYVELFPERQLVRLDHTLAFDIENTGAVGASFYQQRNGVTRPRLEWQLTRLDGAVAGPSLAGTAIAAADCEQHGPGY